MRVPQQHAEHVLQELQPAWVIDSPVDLAAEPADDDSLGSIWNLLADTQHNLDEKVLYTRVVRKFVTQGGVQKGSRLQLYFSPHLEKLSFHSLLLHRNGQTVDLLDEQEVQILNREAELEDHVFEGGLTAVLLLHDTRPGDILEFSFSMRSSDSVIRQRSCGRFVLRYASRSQAARWRLVYSPERQVFALPVNHEKQPAVTYTEGGLVDCRWDMLNLKPLMVEPDTPNWYTHANMVEYGEFASWNEVAQWACHLFYAPSELPPEFAGIVARIAAESPTVPGRIQAAMRFVQDEIRYVSVSVGEHGYRPYDAATVLKRRYGDCKDKASLLSTLLRHVGIDALPALVNTVRRQETGRYLPSPFAFNHSIVRVRDGNETYWIDGTMRSQRGPLDRLYCPEFGAALVISPDTQELEQIAPRGSRFNLLKIAESFKVRSVGLPVELSVNRIYEGARADAMRNYLADTTRDEVEREFLRDYRAIYPKMKTAKAWSFQDDPVGNRLGISLEYVIDDLWRPSDRRGFVVGNFFATGIYHVLRRPEFIVRKTPYAIAHPNNIQNELIIRTTRPLRLARSHVNVECEAFRYKSQSDVVSNALHFQMQFQSMKDHVLPTEMGRYVKAIDQVAGHARQALLLAGELRRGDATQRRGSLR